MDKVNILGMHKEGRWRKEFWAFDLCFRALSKKEKRHKVIIGKVKTLSLMEWDLEMKPTHKRV